jgi:hypothetical protein
MKKILFFLSFIIIAISSSSSFAQNLIFTTFTSGPSVCDGGAYIDSNIVINNPVWAGNGVVLQTGGTSIDSLCAGTYTLTYSDLLGTTSVYTFIIGAGSGNPCAGLTALITTTDATSNIICDGTVDVMVYGGSAPYTYAWNTGATTNLESNLCPGYYTCSVTDAMGCSTSSSAYVIDASLNTLDSILIFNNSNFPGAVIMDSLTTVSIEDCLIDYSSVVSASITNSVQIGFDSLQVTWTLLDVNGQIISTYTVNYFIANPISGVYSATLVVFCYQKSANYNTVQMTDQVYLQNAGLNEENKSNISIINPINTEIHISFNENVNGSVVLRDMNGRSILESRIENTNNLTIDTVKLSQGTYFLEINNAGKVSTHKLMK